MKKRFLLCILLVFALYPLPVIAADDNPPQAVVMIAALQTSQADAAGNDFIVLHNPSDESVDVTGWKLQYRSASAKLTDSWATKRTIACNNAVADCKVVIAAGENLIVATYDVPLLTVQKMTSGFSSMGGQIRLARPGDAESSLEVIDTLGYGSAAEAENAPAPAPSAGKAIVRKSSANGELIDTNNNKSDFIEGCFVPSETKLPALVVCTQPPDDPSPEEEEDPEAPAYAALEISELLPDPVAPAVDSKDEFIEIYNPTAQNVQLKGYVVQAGTDFKDTFTLDDQVLAPGGYIALNAVATSISLTNSGTVVRLLDPSGKVTAMVQNYGQAKPGASWIQVEGVWQWTLQPTPGAVNTLLMAPPPVPAVVAPKKVTTKKAAAKTASSTKAVKGATTTKPKAPAAAKNVAAASVPEPQPVQNFNFLILTIVGLGVLTYAAFEYRHEIIRFGRRAWAAITRQPYTELLPQTNVEKNDKKV